MSNAIEIGKLRAILTRNLCSKQAGSNHYVIHYQKSHRTSPFEIPEFFKREDYTEVLAITAKDMEDVFNKMQADVWSKNGEAKPLIEALGLHHTSMSIGDVIFDARTSKHYAVNYVGFKELKRIVYSSTSKTS